jgi:hypothetical protein
MEELHVQRLHGWVFGLTFGKQPFGKQSFFHAFALSLLGWMWICALGPGTRWVPGASRFLVLFFCFCPHAFSISCSIQFNVFVMEFIRPLANNASRCFHEHKDPSPQGRTRVLLHTWLEKVKWCLPLIYRISFRFLLVGQPGQESWPFISQLLLQREHLSATESLFFNSSETVRANKLSVRK